MTYSKKYISPSSYYSLLLPQDWVVQEEENTTTIYDNNGFGALHITSYLIANQISFDINKELLEFAFGNKQIKGTNDAIKKSANYIWLEKNDDVKYWKYYAFFENNKALFVSYNCDIKDKFIEIDIINSIVDSIKIPSIN